jgi:hypothetical protein
MQADALRSLSSDLDEDTPESPHVKEIFTPETIEEVAHFLHLNVCGASHSHIFNMLMPLKAQDRLRLVLTYLRDKYAYCFWCGMQYNSPDEMDEQCPGPEEDAHD